ncbi:uncharacterized protein At2g27730, mitochondrial isoform X2 [Syzygium oleosum]|uniref:uncharacterized protein At2g27730, mitochondrial isoform X2 n=1 Tax=Syzygium oleosum TaxID=219896 RepID=UPI0024BAD407|nr:uncharacterized protein At2g27730, mitochondrial isoform X2 [Syzygium oleosum]
MATARIAARYVSRRLSSSGKILSEEEKAAENVYIKGPKPGETSGGSVTDAAPGASSASGASTKKVSTDKHRNYAVVAGTVTALGALGWYLKGSSKKPEEVQD